MQQCFKKKVKLVRFVAFQVSIIPSLSLQLHSPKGGKINIIEAVNQQCS